MLALCKSVKEGEGVTVTLAQLEAENEALKDTDALSDKALVSVGRDDSDGCLLMETLCVSDALLLALLLTLALKIVL